MDTILLALLYGVDGLCFYFNDTNGIGVKCNTPRCPKSGQLCTLAPVKGTGCFYVVHRHLRNNFFLRYTLVL